MSPSSIQPSTHPISQAIAHSALSAGAIPVPLVSIAYKIDIVAGLANVTAVRCFRNDEANSIEATLTFPLPVHAVLYRLEARIGERRLTAVAHATAAARHAYEDALERGKTAVLHEELIKGVHLLSVGHIAPGMEVSITTRFAVALSRVAEGIFLHLPTTVGDIYGRSGQPPGRDLHHDSVAQFADLTVTIDRGEVALLGCELRDGNARIPLDAPIRLEVKGWRQRPLMGRAADGRMVTLNIDPAPKGERVLSAAVLIDRSGSMAERCAGDAALSKHAVVLLGLEEAANDLHDGDKLCLWEFNTETRDLGSAVPNELPDLLRNLSEPSGGTEIGKALLEVALSEANDILLITDGKSHALDVHFLARLGVRFTVVLIGEDSLEANVGHLASVTGGEIFVPSGSDVGDAVRSALQAMRHPPGHPPKRHLLRSGMLLHASWTPNKPPPASTNPDQERAVAAYAASLILPRLTTDAAAQLAEAEGIVTHLTSLVLVDEEGSTQEGLPATRKVALPTPRTSRFLSAQSAPLDLAIADHMPPEQPVRMYLREMGSYVADPACLEQFRLKALYTASSRGKSELAPSATVDSRSTLSLSAIAASIQWDKYGDDSAQNLRRLDPAARSVVRESAKLPKVRKVAAQIGLSPLALVFSLMAQLMAAQDPAAAQIAGRALGTIGEDLLLPLKRQLGLYCGD